VNLLIISEDNDDIIQPMTEDTGRTPIPKPQAPDADDELTGEEIEKLADLFASAPLEDDEDTGPFKPVKDEDTGKFKPVSD
jgi:hypothetical protein